MALVLAFTRASLTPSSSPLPFAPVSPHCETEQSGSSGYGAKASADLIVTRGKGFTKAKNKKKRGNYSGGEIALGSK